MSEDGSGLGHGKRERSTRGVEEVAAMPLFISISVIKASMYLVLNVCLRNYQGFVWITS